MERHLNEFDTLGQLQRTENRPDEVEPSMCRAGADVKESGCVRLGDVQRHLDGVLDVDEIASLFAIAILRAMTLKEPHAAGLADLLERFLHEAAHIALVIFVRPEDVEVFQAADSHVETGSLGVEVEKMLRVSITVERPQRVQV